MGFWRQIFLNRIFFLVLFAVIICFVTGFYWPVMTQISKLLLFGVLLMAVVDLILLFSVRKGITGKRTVNDKLSNFDKNIVRISLRNRFGYTVRYTILDEIPPQFQIFDFSISGMLPARRTAELSYDLTPKERGTYQFGKTNVFVESPIRLFQRKIVLDTENEIKVYPSFLKLNQYSLHNFRAYINQAGNKKIRRLGHSQEFEQIKHYVPGDDIRTINWKATAKTQTLMVNQYTDEKSQQIYCAIDKGRTMKMPFGEKTLLDYAINAGLILSNVVLQNHDRAGIFTFSNKMENLVKAENRTNQLNKISENLFNVRSDFLESDFGKLYNIIKHKFRQRSLIVLFTNFESMDSLHRQLPYLKGINKNHLLLVVFFKNTELENYLNTETGESDVYQRTIVEKFVYEKQQIVLELNKHGIQTILTSPEDLTINTINKYLEIKSRAMI